MMNLKEFIIELTLNSHSWMWIMNISFWIHEMEDLGDIVYSWINPPLFHAHILESSNKLLEFVDDSSKELDKTLSKGSKELLILNKNFT